MCGDCGGKPQLAEQSRQCCCCRPEPEPIRAPLHCRGDYEEHLYKPLGEDICAKQPVEPYHIPGYSGQVPTLQSGYGATYGRHTHKVLASRMVEEPDHLSSSLGFGSGRHVCPTPMHEPYRLPGYTGHVPGLQFMVGGSYGHDTHKLLYSSQSYPNRQENLSPYRG